MIGALAGLGIEWKVGLATGAVLAVLGAYAGLYLYAEHAGYARADAAWQLRWSERERQLEEQRFKELDRQASVYAAARAEEDAALEQLRVRLLALSTLNMQLTMEAAEDPNANAIALDSDAVDRHNRRVLQ